MSSRFVRKFFGIYKKGKNVAGSWTSLVEGYTPFITSPKNRPLILKLDFNKIYRLTYLSNGPHQRK
jgi:hypothetical protein